MFQTLYSPHAQSHNSIDMSRQVVQLLSFEGPTKIKINLRLKRLHEEPNTLVTQHRAAGVIKNKNERRVHITTNSGNVVSEN